jgi:hypothetical protein
MRDTPAELRSQLVAGIRSALIDPLLDEGVKIQTLALLNLFGQVAAPATPEIEQLAFASNLSLGLRNSAIATLVTVMGIHDFIALVGSTDSLRVAMGLQGLYLAGANSNGSFRATESERSEMGNWLLALYSSPSRSVRLSATGFGSAIIVSQWFYYLGTSASSIAADSVSILLQKSLAPDVPATVRDSARSVLQRVNDVITERRGSSGK